MTLILAVMGALSGAIIGSFIATLCVRWPRGEQVTGGRSRCDGCSRRLGPLELVPIVSHLAFGGKCRTCGASINSLHLKVELTAAVIAAAALALAPGARGAAIALFCWMLLAPAILDARFHWLPDRLTAALAIAGLAAGGLLAGVPLFDRIVGGVAGFFVLAALAMGYRRMRGRQGMGGGDPKLLGAIGLWTGWAALPAILVIASFAGLAWALLRRKGPSEAVAFGTLLALGALIWSFAILLFPDVSWIGGAPGPMKI